MKVRQSGPLQVTCSFVLALGKIEHFGAWTCLALATPE